MKRPVFHIKTITQVLSRRLENSCVNDSITVVFTIMPVILVRCATEEILGTTRWSCHQSFVSTIYRAGMSDMFKHEAQ